MKFPSERCTARPSRRAPALVLAALAMALAFAAAGCGQQPVARGNPNQLAANPGVDPGSPLGGQPAPDFRLRDQSGQLVSLSQFRGKAVLLAFVDSRCSTICPLTTTSLVEAVRLMGAAGKHVQLLGINANPKATAVSDDLA